MPVIRQPAPATGGFAWRIATADLSTLGAADWSGLSSVQVDAIGDAASLTLQVVNGGNAASLGPDGGGVAIETDGAQNDSSVTKAGPGLAVGPSSLAGWSAPEDYAVVLHFDVAETVVPSAGGLNVGLWDGDLSSPAQARMRYTHLGEMGCQHTYGGNIYDSATSPMAPPARVAVLRLGPGWVRVFSSTSAGEVSAGTLAAMRLGSSASGWSQCFNLQAQARMEAGSANATAEFAEDAAVAVSLGTTNTGTNARCRVTGVQVARFGAA